MAEGSVETVGVAAKLTSATAGGALWGIFATAFLVIPSIVAAIVTPLLKKTKEKVEEKVNEVKPSTPAEPVKVKVSKTEKQYQAKKEQLEQDRQIQMLTEELNRLSAKKASRKKQAASTVTI